MNPLFLVAALADVTAVIVHGYVGHRLIVSRLMRERLFSTREFGDAGMSRRVLVVTWHAVTAAFACSALAMALWAFSTGTGRSGPLFVSAMHASFLVVGLVVMGRGISGLLRRPKPIPIGFVTCMTTVVLMGLLGSL